MTTLPISPISAMEFKGEASNMGTHPHVEPKSLEKPSEDTKTIHEKRERILDEVMKHCPSKLGHFKEAYQGKSRKASMTAYCIQCAGYEPKEVRTCPATACPLWAFRPYK